MHLPVAESFVKASEHQLVGPHHCQQHVDSSVVVLRVHQSWIFHHRRSYEQLMSSWRPRPLDPAAKVWEAHAAKGCWSTAVVALVEGYPGALLRLVTVVDHVSTRRVSTTAMLRAETVPTPEH